MLGKLKPGMPLEGRYVFMLFISGMSIRSTTAIENLRIICDNYLAGNFELEIIDIRQDPDLALEHNILATPTLLKISPFPRKIILGDLSAIKKVLRQLDITEVE